MNMPVTVLEVCRVVWQKEVSEETGAVGRTHINFGKCRHFVRVHLYQSERVRKYKPKGTAKSRGQRRSRVMLNKVEGAVRWDRRRSTSNK